MNENTFNDYTPFAALSVGQAKELFRAMIAREFENANKPADVQGRDIMSIKDAIKFLDENGYPLSIKTVYGFTSSGNMPCRHIGKRLVFSKKELLQWIESRTSNPETKTETALKLAESANYKR